MADCLDLSEASYASGAWPDIRCHREASEEECMASVKLGGSHLLALRGKNIYTGGRYHSLQPIATVLHNVSTYDVAVTKFSSDINELQQLRGHRSCHTGMGHTAGWVCPVGVLVSHGLLPPVFTCGHVSAMTDFFSSSCVPGANDTSRNPGRVVYSAELCTRCIGDESRENRCAADSRERYFGHAGALRCLQENGGDVAFLKHTTLLEYTDGHTRDPWTVGLKTTDFQLICGQGGSDHVENYQECNIGKLPAQQVLIKENTPGLRRLQLSRVLADAASFLSNDSKLYRMFRAGNESSGLFKSSATGLIITHPQVTYEEVLGKDFLDACIVADPYVCTMALTDATEMTLTTA